MELLYLYIEDDRKNIKDCEFNFSSEFKFLYNKKDKIIKVIKNENYISDFWGTRNISNITAVIGQNGTGKSNLFKLLVGNGLTDSLLIQVHKNNNSLIIYSNYKIEANNLTENDLIIEEIKNVTDLYLIHPILQV